MDGVADVSRPILVVPTEEVLLGKVAAMGVVVVISGGDIDGMISSAVVRADTAIGGVVVAVTSRTELSVDVIESTSVDPTSPSSCEWCVTDEDVLLVFVLLVGSGLLAFVGWWGKCGRSPASLVRCANEKESFVVTDSAIELDGDVLMVAATVEFVQVLVVELKVDFDDLSWS